MLVSGSVNIGVPRKDGVYHFKDSFRAFCDSFRVFRGVTTIEILAPMFHWEEGYLPMRLD